MWLYPGLPILVTTAIVAVLISMGFREANRIELMQGVAVWVVLTIVYVLRKRLGGRGSGGSSSVDSPGVDDERPATPQPTS